MRARVNPEEDVLPEPAISPAPMASDSPAGEPVIVHARTTNAVIEIVSKRSSLSSSEGSQRASVTPPSAMIADLLRSKSRQLSDSGETNLVDLRRSKSRQPSDSAGEETVERSAQSTRLMAAGIESSDTPTPGVKQNIQPEQASQIGKTTPPSDEVEVESKVSRAGYHEGDEKSEALLDESTQRATKLTSFHSASVPEMPRYSMKNKGSVCAVGPTNGGDRHWLPIPLRPPIFEASRLQRYSVPMHDGVLLAVDVYLPFKKRSPKSVSFPTALHFTRFNRDWSFKKKACCWASLLCCCCCGCYLKRLKVSGYPGCGSSHWNIRTGQQVEQFCSAGYAWVSVDVRGTGASQGKRPSDLHPDEVQDLAEVAQWIEAQPWSSGKIICTGSNYDGLLAALLASRHLTSVVAVAPLFMPFDLYDELLYPGGIRCRAACYENCISNIVSVSSQVSIPFLICTMLQTMLSGPSPGPGGKEELDRALQERKTDFDFSDAAKQHINRDDPVLGLRNIDEISLHTAVVAAGHSPIALLLICGWMDAANALGAIRYYTLAEQKWLQNHSGHRPRLVIGPWSREAKLNCSPFARSSKPHFSMNAELLRFFDGKVDLEDIGESKAMLGAKNEVPVHYFTIGEERWKASTAWPPPHNNLRLDLAQNKVGLRLKFLKNTEGRSIREELAAEHQALSMNTHDSTTWICDSRSTSGPTSRWAFTSVSSRSPLYPDRAIQDRRNLVYDSSPLTYAIEVTGHPFVTLYLATDVKDASVFVYLEEKRRDGRVVYVTEGQLRLCHRAIGVNEGPYPSPVPYRSYTSAERSPTEANTPYRVIIPLLPCSFQFSVDSCIRLSIASRDLDNFDPLPEPEPSVFTIFHRHSYLNLPEVKPMT